MREFEEANEDGAEGEGEAKPTFEDGFEPNAGQALALDKLQRWARGEGPERVSLCGAAGTGKTVCLKALKEYLRSRNVIWTAMTGKAATRMREAAGVSAATLHAKLYEPPEVSGKSMKFADMRQPEGNVLVIDEASMVTPQLNEDLDYWIEDFGVRVLFVGDGFQLPPVLSREEEKKYGKNDYSIFSKVEGPLLTQVMRNGDAVLDVATELRTKGTLSTTNRGGYDFKRVPDPGLAAVEAYLEDPDSHYLITWTNVARMLANLEIRKRRGIIEAQPQPGEPVLVCKNALGGTVLNGEVYTIDSIKVGPTIAKVPTVLITSRCGKFIRAHAKTWDGSTPYFPDIDDWKEYQRELQRMRMPEPLPITYGYCLTAHKAQGSEARRVTVFLPKKDTGNPHWRAPTALPNGGTASFGTRFLYTSMTRAKQRVSILMGS